MHDPHLPEQPLPVAGQVPAAPLPQAAALLIRGGAVLHPERYVRAVWRACERLVQQHPASQATLRLQQVTSLAALEAHHGPFDAIIVAAGAAAATIAEIGGLLHLVQPGLILLCLHDSGRASATNRFPDSDTVWRDLSTLSQSCDVGSLQTAFNCLHVHVFACLFPLSCSSCECIPVH